MGALPDDAKQDLRIEYLQKDVEKLQQLIEELKEKKQDKKKWAPYPKIL